MTAAVIINLYLLRRMTGGRLHRPHEQGLALTSGIVLYPASLLVLVLLFRSRPDIVAASWGILAAGDGAATLVGGRWGRRRWTWNRSKSIAGSIALLVAGGCAGAVLAWWCRPAATPVPPLWFSIAAPFAAALAAAVVETSPLRLDDNISVPVTSAIVLWGLSAVSPPLAMAAALAMPAALIVAVPLNAGVAAAGLAAGTVSRGGAVAGAIIGTIIHAFAGWPGWLLLMAAFGCAVLTSRAGLERKQLLGIAEERGGRRGAGNAMANTGVAAVAAVGSAIAPFHAAALIAFTAALVAGASDTAASEIGKAWGRRTFALVPPHAVPPGTPGAMSAEGTIAGLGAAVVLAGLAIAAGLAPRHALFAIIAGATTGALLESLLASVLEPRRVLDNNALNLINTACAAGVAVWLAGPLS
jgi:uncharacterized protein (TIGR00297 family)